MNTKIISAICITLAICLAIYFYAEWQKAKFDAALPPPPPVEEQAGGHWHADEWHADGTHADDKLIPNVDWEQHGQLRELVKPDNLDELDANDPVAKAWAKVDSLAENRFAYGGTTHPQTDALIAQLMPPIEYFETEGDAEEVIDLIDDLASLQDPRSIEVLVTYMAGGNLLSGGIEYGLIDLGPPVIPYLIPYLDKSPEMEGGSLGMSMSVIILGAIGAQHRADLDGIVEHIILPKLEILHADDALWYSLSVTIEETLDMLKK